MIECLAWQAFLVQRLGAYPRAFDNFGLGDGEN